ncbi:MAG: hypothetical protein D6679_05400, partial [Candidatus Hydrogenedentota bacterium]
MILPRVKRTWRSPRQIRARLKNDRALIRRARRLKKRRSSSDISLSPKHPVSLLAVSVLLLASARLLIHQTFPLTSSGASAMERLREKSVSPANSACATAEF